jgi:hypothetical protein
VVRRPALFCLLALLLAGDAIALGPGKYGVPRAELDAIVHVRAAPSLASDASRVIAPTSTLPPPSVPATTTTVPSGPADPPPPPAAPPLPLRPARLDADFPDPSVVWGGDRWYAFATGTGGRNVQVSASSDLLSWTPPVEAVPMLPPWSKAGFTWAPAVAQIGAQWVMYASIVGTPSHCVDRLVSTAPGGPYLPVDGGPLVCDQTGGNGSIDPSVMTVGGVSYLYWKADGARTRQLWGVPLTPDGLAFAGSPQHVLSASARWQNGGIENPSMVTAGGAEWLVYSGAYWATGKYAMGYARCDSPLGPCHEMSGNGPWLASLGDVVGPGGGAVFSGPDGVLRLAYHAWAGGPGYASGGLRLLHVEVIDVGPNGPAIIDRPPQGAVSSLVIGPDGVSIEGHVTDPDSPAPVVTSIYLDGEKAASMAAQPTFGLSLAPADGLHRICVVALDDLQQSRPTIGCRDFTISSVPFGAVDPIGGTALTGWAIGPATADPINVDVYVDGDYVVSARADLARADVGAAWPAYGAPHGFSAPLPTLTPGRHTVCAYGVTDDNQPAPTLGCITA